MSDEQASKKDQKVIGYGISEELYNKIQSHANVKNQKISLYMRNFTNRYFTDDDTKMRVIIDLPKDKLTDKAYIKALLQQKMNYILENI